MPRSLVKMVKLNNLQYNANHDPQVYRRLANEPFRIQALLNGGGSARCRITDQSGAVLAEQLVALPGTFTQELTFPDPGTQMVRLTVEAGDVRYAQDLRLDVLEGSAH
jgi:hypothetical protein